MVNEISKGASEQNQSWEDLLASGAAGDIRTRLQDELTDIYKKWRRRLRGYSVLILFQHESISGEDADKIYQALEDLNPDRKNNVLLIMVSNGGQITPAYQISKLCREWSKEKFVAVVPREAKSAATLIALGADVVHMGPLGHLGPIDPMYNGVAGLAIKESIRTITKLTHEYPGSSEMWAEVLYRDGQYQILGHYERTVEASVQYGQRLLISGKSDPERAAKIADHLVYGYKNHGFVIDKEEAREIFGEERVVDSSNELSFGEEIYRLISRVDNGIRTVKDDDNNLLFEGLSVVGSIHDGVTIIPRPKEVHKAGTMDEGPESSSAHKKDILL